MKISLSQYMYFKVDIWQYCVPGYVGNILVENFSVRCENITDKL